MTAGHFGEINRKTANISVPLEVPIRLIIENLIVHLNTSNISLHVLLADDDSDDRYFFDKALKELPFATQLTTAENGANLMSYLLQNAGSLPDILFLDYNMPRKNGAECLAEIKRHPLLKELPVIIYSTSLHEDVADVLYISGAHFYIHKAVFSELKKVLQHVLMLIAEKKFSRPARAQFILSSVEV